MTTIDENLYLGDAQDASDFLRDYPQGFVLSVHEALPRDIPGQAAWLPILDDQGNADVNQLDRASLLIEHNRAANRPVLVHCRAGVERSPLTVAWYLSRRENRSLNNTYADIQDKRPQVENRLEWLPHGYR